MRRLERTKVRALNHLKIPKIRLTTLDDDWSVAKPIIIAVGTGVIAAGTAGAF